MIQAEGNRELERCVCIRHVIFMLVVRGIQNCEVQRLATTDLEGTVVKLQIFGVF